MLKKKKKLRKGLETCQTTATASRRTFGVKKKKSISGLSLMKH